VVTRVKLDLISTSCNEKKKKKLFFSNTTNYTISKKMLKAFMKKGIKEYKDREGFHTDFFKTYKVLMIADKEAIAAEIVYFRNDNQGYTLKTTDTYKEKSTMYYCIGEILRI
jgi:ribulose bisphosphate carboxylase small subunit